jgi:serine/threonine protein kinase
MASPAAAGAEAGAGASANNILRRFMERSRPRPSFFIERGADNKLYEVKNPSDATWKFPDGTLFLDYIASHRAEKPIGRGGFGFAFLLTFGENHYVLKRIYKPGAKGRREIVNLAELDGSPFVLYLLAGAVFSDYAYILSPYVPGVRLDDWLDTHPGKEDRIRVYNQLLEGLEYIHSKGIVHRDVKPQNIWVPDDISKPAFYLDFGTSVRIGEKNTFSGTEHYMPYGKLGRLGIQTPELNYFSLGIIFEEDPVPDGVFEVNLRRFNIKANTLKGKRFSRKGRKSRRNKNHYSN